MVIRFPVEFRAFLALLTLGALIACNALDAKGQSVQHEWVSSESAPRDAPIFFLRGDITLADGGSDYIPDNRITHKGWGQIGSTHLAADDVKALPRQVTLSWFSYPENRFWGGQFTLPMDRLATLMARGAPMPDGRPREKYQRVIFGMAPGGNVSVWASAGPVVTEVATFKAAPAERPWSDISTNPDIDRETHVREVLDDLGPGTADRLRAAPELLQVWNDYPRRLAWSPQLAGTSPQGATVWIKGLNGEHNWADLADPTRGGEPLPDTLPMPAALTLKWRLPGKVRSADITLDPVEVVAAFKKLSAADRPGLMTLMLEPSATGGAVDVFLRRGELAYRFTNNQTKLYGSD